MSIQRPQHLVRRQVQGRMFGEDATLVTVGTSVNDFGEPSSTETTADITCATAPVSAGDARARIIEEGGVALSDLRLFWTAEELDPVTDGSAGDIVIYEGERFRIRETARYGSFSESVGQRQEPQPIRAAQR